MKTHCQTPTLAGEFWTWNSILVSHMSGRTHSPAVASQGLCQQEVGILAEKDLQAPIWEVNMLIKVMIKVIRQTLCLVMSPLLPCHHTARTLEPWPLPGP